VGRVKVAGMIARTATGGFTGRRACAAAADAGSFPASSQYRNTDMPQQTDAERELAQLLVESLNLEGVEPDAIDPEAPLFNDGLGLDSIDALELSLAVGKRYGVQLRAEGEDNRRIFSSLRALSAHVQSQRAP
jgi:acyl carrier protein